MAILYVAAGVVVFAIVAAVTLELIGWAGRPPDELDDLDVEYRTRPHGNADRL